MVSEKTKKEALEIWAESVRRRARSLVDEASEKSNADFGYMKEKAQEIVNFIIDLEENELKEEN